MKVLITGISGKMGRLVAKRLYSEGYEVLGIDIRSWDEAPSDIRIFPADLRKRGASEVFRTEKPDTVVHLATITNLSKGRTHERQRLNLGGTKAVFDCAGSSGVKHMVFVGRHTYYGAVSDASLYRVETDPPLGISSFPELGDLVAADLYAGSAIWRMPEMKTCILRICYTLGPTHSGQLARYLNNDRVSMVLGYDPLYQFMHEVDVVDAILAAIKSQLNGVYNVSGPQPLPLSTLIRGVGKLPVRLPERAIAPLLGKLGFPNLPKQSLEHLKYPVLVDSSPFAAETGWVHHYDDLQTMSSFCEPLSYPTGLV